MVAGDEEVVTGEEVTEDTTVAAEDFSSSHHHHHHYDHQHHHSAGHLKHSHAPEPSGRPPTGSSPGSQTRPAERETRGYQTETSLTHEDLATSEHEGANTSPAEDAGREGGAPRLRSEDGPDIQGVSETDVKSESVCRADGTEPSDPRTVERTESVTREETEPDQSASSAGLTGNSFSFLPT